ncbi:hypothetical protein JW921_00235 [Candidatus Fermentibacterales bacterium]|nr:hypothetical protein [Candidatus Fermentibacterales bacterium]
MKRSRFCLPALTWLLLATPPGCPASELLRVVTEPTAGVLSARTYYASLATFPNEGLVIGLDVGVVPRLMVGVRYGGEHLTGLSDPVWYDHVRVAARFRFLDESLALPGIALGFSNQEEGPRTGATYSRLSRGVYLSASKNFELEGSLAFHAGVSLSLEDSDHAGCWLGLDKSLPGGFGVALDYDPATNEADSVRFDEGGGFVSAEIFWQSFGQVRVSLQLRDLLETGGQTYRALAVDFLGLFL